MWSCCCYSAITVATDVALLARAGLSLPGEHPSSLHSREAGGTRGGLCRGLAVSLWVYRGPEQPQTAMDYAFSHF